MTTTSAFICDEFSQLPKFCKRKAHVDRNIMRSTPSCLACYGKACTNGLLMNVMIDCV